MRISPYYDRKKKLITFLIGITTFLIGSLVTIDIYQNPLFTSLIIPIAVTLAILTIVFSVFLPYLHKSSYYRMSKIDLEFHEHPERRFPPRV